MVLIYYTKLFTLFIQIPVFNAYNVNPDQMSHFAVSDLGLHCLPITVFRVFQLKCVNLDC